MKPNPAFLLTIVLGLAVAASSCGRRGDLETPSAAAAEARGEAAPAESAAPERSFVLDALIE